MRVLSERQLAIALGALLASALPPDVVLVQTSVSSDGTGQQLREVGRSPGLRL
jgi:hypothetical protein